MASLTVDMEACLSLLISHPLDITNHVRRQSTSCPQSCSDHSMEFTVETEQQSQPPEREEAKSLPDGLARLTCEDLPFLLPMPQNGDDLDTTARKMESLASVVSSGRSLSIAPGQAPASKPKHKQTVEEYARERMTEPETTQYDAWKMGIIQLPLWDWWNYRVPVAPEATQTFSRCALAMDIIWDRKGMAAEHAAWLIINMPCLMPLIRAVTKLLRAEEYFQKNQRPGRMSDRDIAEVEMLQLVNATAEENVMRERERLRLLIDSIHKSQAALMNRMSIFEK